MSVSDNERRLDVIEGMLRDRVSEHFCEERNGRTMDAVDALKETTRDLSKAVDGLRKENTAASRQTRATLISVIMLGLSIIGVAIFRHLTE